MNIIGWPEVVLVLGVLALAVALHVFNRMQTPPKAKVRLDNVCAEVTKLSKKVADLQLARRMEDD